MCTLTSSILAKKTIQFKHWYQGVNFCNMNYFIVVESAFVLFVAVQTKGSWFLKSSLLRNHIHPLYGRLPTHTSEGNVFVCWQEPSLAQQSPADTRRGREREGSEEECPGWLSAAGSMVSHSYCSGGTTMFILCCKWPIALKLGASLSMLSKIKMTNCVFSTHTQNDRILLQAQTQCRVLQHVNRMCYTNSCDFFFFNQV